MLTKQMLRCVFSCTALAFLTNPADASEEPGGGSEIGEVMVKPSATPDAGIDVKAKVQAEEAVPFKILGETIPPGERRRLQWRSPQSFGGFVSPAPLIVVNGERPGPVMCFTSAVHGDELNGIEISRRVLEKLTTQALRGTVVSVPIVNFEGFLRLNRYLGNRWDLNRFFPGDASGSYPSRVAHALFQDVIVKCDALVDLHTGSHYGENLPQVRGDLAHSGVAKLVDGFGGLSIMQDVGPPGSLRGAATRAGVPAVVLEIGDALTINIEQVEIAVDGIFTMLRRLGMLDRGLRLLEPKPAFYHIEWIRSNTSGILINEAKLGERVSKGQKLAVIIDPVKNEREDVLAPLDGTIVGRAQNQFVSPGFSLFRVGVEKTLEEMAADADAARRESEPEPEVDPESEQKPSEAIPKEKS